jgi:hypothetical protein
MSVNIAFNESTSIGQQCAQDLLKRFSDQLSSLFYIISPNEETYDNPYYVPNYEVAVIIVSILAFIRITIFFCFRGIIKDKNISSNNLNQTHLFITIRLIEFVKNMISISVDYLKNLLNSELNLLIFIVHLFFIVDTSDWIIASRGTDRKIYSAQRFDSIPRHCNKYWRIPNIYTRQVYKYYFQFSKF